MRAGNKTEAETGKTRPCIVYVKNLKESETTEIINSAVYSKQSKIVRNAAAKVPNKRTNTSTEKDHQKEREREQERDLRSTRTTRRAASIANIELLSKRQTAAIGKSPIAAPASAGRVRNIKSNASTVPRATVTVKSVAVTPLSKRRNTELPVDRRQISSESKTRMYKQSKITVSTPPPTIAASRSRRSIKPNPKYASDDMVTPKYVSGLANESSTKRAGKALFMDDEDEDEDLHDLIEEDDDDELNDAAFNPQLHKSDGDDDDDDDISEGEFVEQLRREIVPPKRGRGRPPKNPQAIAAQAARATSSASTSQYQTGRGMTQAGRGGVTNLQQLRRTMAVNANLARSNMTAGMGVTVGNKRKLEDSNDTPIARKRIATDMGSAAGRAPPVINGNQSVAKTTAIGLTKPKVIMGNNNSNNSSNTGVRLIQTPNVKARPGTSFKVNTPVARSVGGATTGVVRAGTAVRQLATPGGNVKMQKTTGAGGGGSVVSLGNAKMKADSQDDVPTFTIVNIDDIFNQDDVLITRSSNSKKKVVRNNNNSNNNNNNSNNNNSRNKQLQLSSSATASSASSTTSNNLNLSSSIKHLKSMPTGITTSLSTFKASSNKQMPLMETKPRPRILNAEMGKKTPMMKPLMSMSKELCPMPDGGDTEDEDMSNDLDDDITTISPPARALSTTQQRVVRRVQTNKWVPNTRRNILSTATSVNASTNNQRQQQQQQLGSDRKLTKLLGESSDDDVFKKPASPSTTSPSTTALTTLQQRRSKENEDEVVAAATTTTTTTTVGASPVADTDASESKPSKYFPPETTTYCEEDGRIVKKVTCYETWHVIGAPKESSNKTRQQRTCLELPLVKLANVASRIKMPSNKWTSKVTLYKVSPSLMQRQTMTIFTGDLKSYNIPEEERHKYQPSCVLFRRSALDRNKCRVPFDRAIIFKNKCFYANIEGKHVNLLGAPEVVNSVQEVESLIDIVDHLALSSDLVEMVTSK